MNYIPKRVFLLDCGKYIELSYEEFCEKKEETEKLPDAIAEGKDAIQRLRCAIDRLTNEERGLILAHFFFHATQEELARHCGITQAAVSQRLQRILRKLRRELESA